MAFENKAWVDINLFFLACMQMDLSSYFAPLAKYPSSFLAEATSWYGFYHIDELRAQKKYG